MHLYEYHHFTKGHKNFFKRKKPDLKKWRDMAREYNEVDIS